MGADIAEAIVAEGHARADFVIVGSGPNAASPHHEVSDRVFEGGDPVVVDIGGTMPSGYCSDCTRTYAIGEPPAEFADYYQVLQAAQDAACARCGPASARRRRRGRQGPDRRGRLRGAFVHRTGHGIGLETHEDPYIVAGQRPAAAAGHGVLGRAGHLPRAARRQDRGHRGLHARTAASGSTPSAASSSCWTPDDRRRPVPTSETRGCSS